MLSSQMTTLGVKVMVMTSGSHVKAPLSVYIAWWV
jgi:hypothetical protein